jgi:hypothetical protein
MTRGEGGLLGADGPGGRRVETRRPTRSRPTVRPRLTGWAGRRTRRGWTRPGGRLAAAQGEGPMSGRSRCCTTPSLRGWPLWLAGDALLCEGRSGKGSLTVQESGRERRAALLMVAVKGSTATGSTGARPLSLLQPSHQSSRRPFREVARKDTAALQPWSSSSCQGLSCTETRGRLDPTSSGTWSASSSRPRSPSPRRRLLASNARPARLSCLPSCCRRSWTGSILHPAGRVAPCASLPRSEGRRAGREAQA